MRPPQQKLSTRLFIPSIHSGDYIAPQNLVVTRLYRYVRNPMYVAVVAVTLGQPHACR
jgi:protein-S-isoprenylcysteine O-methyltransferase Ste14